ncbi:MAG: hypothetical protein LBJ74_05335 [Heliobacteriaceae bacterium]|jgi:hypothetical protein|nr:hypothetical protein [Heliobacteriaceae bacterium]
MYNQFYSRRVARRNPGVDAVQTVPVQPKPVEPHVISPEFCSKNTAEAARLAALAHINNPSVAWYAPEKLYK